MNTSSQPKIGKDDLRNGSVDSGRSSASCDSRFDSFDAAEKGSPSKTWDDEAAEGDNIHCSHDDRSVRTELRKEMPENSQSDGNIVTWEGPSDPTNPKNWTRRRKWFTTVIVGMLTLLSPVASSMPAPALGSISKDFSIESQVETQLVLSIFVLSYAFGPLVLGPLSEVYGRLVVLQISSTVFAVFTLACGFARTKEQLIVFRSVAGLGGSAPLAIGGAIIGDCWRAHERGRAIAVFSTMPLLATALGPLAGGFVVENATWRWIFFSITIACAAMQIISLLALKESHAPEILRRKKRGLIKKTGNRKLHTEMEESELRPDKHLMQALERPFKLLFTQPIVQAMALYMAYVYGLIYLVMSTFPVLWSSPNYYAEGIGHGGLNYISLGLGYGLGGQVCTLFNDRIYRHLQEHGNQKRGRPEFRLPLTLPASLLIPVGLFWYGWTAETRQHWILPNIGAFLYAFGSIVVFQCIQAYIVDAYTQYAASSLAAVVVLRSVCGFGFPLFAPYMYDSLGYGWGNSLLGFLALVVGLPTPILLWRYGEALRSRSRFCTPAHATTG